MSNHIKIEMTAIPENEMMIRSLSGLFIAPLDPTIDQLTEIKTIISEGITNCIIHGYANQEEGIICIEMELKERVLNIKIEDFGCGIEDLEKAKEPLYTTKPELERSGMGMTIMQSLSDSFEITSKVNQGTIVKMSKVL